MQVNNKDGLKKFLTFKLETVPSKNVSQISLISLWLIEIIMFEIGSLQKSEEPDSAKLSLLKSEFKALVNNPQVNVSQCHWFAPFFNLILLSGMFESQQKSYL